MERKTQGTREWKYDRMIPFLSLLLLHRRPNLGLFGPNTTPHKREKVFCNLPILKSPILLIRRQAKNNLTGNFFYVKSEFLIIKLLIIENFNSYLQIPPFNKICGGIPAKLSSFSHHSMKHHILTSSFYCLSEAKLI
jgi:hypothetical protein